MSPLEINMTQLPESAIKELRGNSRGEVVAPSDATYDQVRKVWNGMIDKHPLVIVRASGAADVVASVKFAREKDLPVSIRGGGHNVGGNAVCDDGLMVDLSRMRSIRVDPKARRVRAEPGLTWREFDHETQAFGLGTTGGLVSTTGIAGFTLGGGIGWLVRKHGLASDNVTSVDVVTADGKLVTANERENTDLFWGVRGGGGNFGVVTSFEYQLHPLGPLVVGGLVAHYAKDGRELLRFYREFVKNSPNELTTLAVYMTAPPAPFIPSDAHGKQLVAIALCYSGNIDDGQKLVRPLREFGKPVLTHIEPMPYAALQSMFDASAPPNIQNYWKSSYIKGLTDQAIDTLLECGGNISSPMSAIHIHQLGGAMAAIPENASAFSHRDAPYIVNLVGTWQDPNENQKHIAWTKNSFLAIQKFAIGSYVNFLGEEGNERVKEAYGDKKFAELVALKKKYDPANTFRFNQNIRPN
jgi:FAD/FMN-containing dehydrogenase